MSTYSPKVHLHGVPETALWTLHNRASEAKRPDAVLWDPEAIRIYESIDYDFRGRFGKPDDSHAMRSRLFDRVVRPWIMEHEAGCVVELACGLETELQRCDDGEVRWLCVDVPEALALRQRFLPPTRRCRFVPKSAFDLSWMELVPAERGVLVTAQGLFMYFEQAQVQRLVTAIFERFPGVELMFDAIPRWFSRKTLQGFHKTPRYKAPPMPWGIDRDEIEPTLRAWSDRVASVDVTPFGAERGPLGALLKWCVNLRPLRNLPPTVVHVKTRAG